MFKVNSKRNRYPGNMDLSGLLELKSQEDTKFTFPNKYQTDKRQAVIGH